jgi:hypothetical protein
MPIPRKYTAEDWRLYYEEFKRRQALEGITLKEFCMEKGLPYKTASEKFKRLEARMAGEAAGGAGLGLAGLEEASPAREVAQDAVAATVQRAIAQESKATTELYLALGKKIWDAFAHYASKKGWDLSKLKDLPIHEYVLEALRKAEDFDRLADDYGRLATQFEYLRSRVDPLVRLENAMELMTSFLEVSMLFKAFLGIDLVRTEVGQWFAGLVEDYMMGRYPKVFKVG